MTEKWDTLTKKELLELLESYDDEKHIVFKVNLKQGTVGFWDVKKDEINSDTDKLVLMSPALDKWYAEDIQELVEENNELKKESYGNLDGLESYKSLYSDVCEKYDNLEADYDDLKKENEQLKSELRTLRDFRGFITEKNVFNEKELQKTQKELILIKNTIKEMYDNERTHLGHNVLAQLMEAIQ